MIQMLFADRKGKICKHPVLLSSGMEGGVYFRLRAPDLIELPRGSQIFTLPHRSPVGYNPRTGHFEPLAAAAGTISAFTPPGYTTTFNSAYSEIGRPKVLPLFSYAATALYKRKICVTAFRTDRDPRHDSRFINMEKVRRNIEIFRKYFRQNRLISHLADCALIHGCPNAQNFFLSRYECPLPVSPSCNAQCAGCISYQPTNSCVATQPRIKFIPTAEELSEIALFHISNAPDPIVSFGQGCEGEPIMQGKIIEKTIRIIRKYTCQGSININTNGSRPDIVGRLFDAGLNTMRVSLNSVRESYYLRYYRPRGYLFKDVVRSIKTAKSHGGFVSINYLSMPGFTDSRIEFDCLKKFIINTDIDMIQWRNLNYDPIAYFSILRMWPKRPDILGMTNVLRSISREFPHIMSGYFNPGRSKIDKLKGGLYVRQHRKI